MRCCHDRPYNTELIGQASTDSVVVSVRESFTIAGSPVALFVLNTRLALISLAIGPLIAWLVTIINRKFRRYSRRIQDSMGDITRVAKETLKAPRVIKIYDAQRHQTAQFDAVNEHNRRSHMHLVLTAGLANPTVLMLMALASAAVLSIAIADAVHGRTSVGDLLAFLVALVSINQPLRSLVNGSGPLQQGIAAGKAFSSSLTSQSSRRVAAAWLSTSAVKSSSSKSFSRTR